MFLMCLDLDGATEGSIFRSGENRWSLWFDRDLRKLEKYCI